MTTKLQELKAVRRESGKENRTFGMCRLCFLCDNVAKFSPNFHIHKFRKMEKFLKLFGNLLQLQVYIQADNSKTFLFFRNSYS